MNELFNIIKNSLRTNSFYIPSQHTYVNGCSLTIKQYNDLLELDATLEFGFEQYIKHSILTDTIIKENVDNYESLLYFDKPFLLAQIKLAQESNFLGFSLAEYKEGISNRISTVNLSSYEAVYNSNNLVINFGLNSFKDVQQINKEYLETLNGKYNLAGDVISLEIFKHLKEISYLNQSIGSVRNIKELKPLIDQMPAGLVETFNGLLSKVNENIRELNKFEIDGENFVFNPSLEFMLS
jgi:hypothetical protein